MAAEDFIGLKEFAKERRKKLEPLRIAQAIKELEGMGFTVELVHPSELHFFFDGELVRFWPFTGWHSGKGISDGRGLDRLLKQLRTQPVSKVLEARRG